MNSRPSIKSNTVFITPLATLICSMTLWLMLLGDAHAQRFNSKVAGDLTSLHELLLTQTSSSCSNASCPLSITPIRLALRAPSLPRINITLIEAKTANPVQQSSVSHERNPILLRGHVLPPKDRPTRSDTKIPVAATIFRDSYEPVLEVALPQRPIRGRKGQQGIVVFRTPLSILATTGRLNARAQAPPARAFSGRTCSVDFESATVAPEVRGFASQSISVRPSATYQVLYLATDYDIQFAKKAGCESAAECYSKIISIIHRAAVFYENQLGYTLEVARQFGPTNYSTTTNSETLLDQFQQNNAATRLQFAHTGNNTAQDQVDLFQLFTGRTLDGSTIGIAYVDTACRNDQAKFSDLVVQRVSDTLDPVTTAHEIGHTLNAQHTSSGIMRAELGTNPPSSFASSSLLAISSHLSQWYPECRQGTSSSEPTPPPTPSGTTGGSSDPTNPFAGKPVTLGLNVSTPSPRALAISANLSSIQAGCVVRLHVGATAVAALKGPVVSERIPRAPSVSWLGSALVRVPQSASMSPSVYFFTDYTCSDGTTLEVSQVRKFNPNRIRGISKRVRSKRTWIKELISSLQ